MLARHGRGRYVVVDATSPAERIHAIVAERVLALLPLPVVEQPVQADPVDPTYAGTLP
jgi:hypothetical protein